MTIKPIRLLLLSISFCWTALALSLSGCGDNLSGVESVCGDGEVGDGEECDDGNTNDGDGCSSTCQSEPGGGEICDDGADNDGDGDTDCADADCAGDPACTEVDCTDGADNDGDGNADCADTDCSAEPTCAGLCAAPIELADPSVIEDDTTGRTDFVAGFCQIVFEGGDGADIAYTVTPVNDVLELVLSSDTDQGIHVRTECNDETTEEACADFELGGTDEQIVMNVRPGEPVIVFVSAFTAGDGMMIPDQAGPFTLSVASRPSVCGDGVLEGVEVCDDGNTEADDGCDPTCIFEQVCGDGVLVGPLFDGVEECDDGNTTGGDGCSDTCTLEGTTDEKEPNEDGSPEPLVMGEDPDQGNDFDTVNSTVAFTDSVILAAALNPSGDEDVFLFENPSPVDRVIFFDIFGGQTGFGVSCQDATDTVLHLRDDMGMTLLANDDRDGANDRCSSIGAILPPGFQVYAHVLAFGDTAPIDRYWLSARYTVCGDGVAEGAEECDDGNTTPGDGCDENCLGELVCGDGNQEPPEQCDDGNTTPGDGCDENCMLELTCGDGIVASIDNGGNEECDDGNTANGDGCDSTCLVEAVSETEPNEDGTPETGGSGTDGNDFDAAGANGPFSTGDIIEAAMTPAGDEDVFEFENTTNTDIEVAFETFKQGLGIGVPCGLSLDTVLTIRDSMGVLLAQNDDKVAGERCSLVSATIPAMSSVFVHVSEFGDNDETDAYFITTRTVVCGDGVTDGNEQCDDGGTTPGDGCDASCQNEPAETEPNDDFMTADAYVSPFFADISPSGDNDFVAVTLGPGETEITAELTDSGDGACAGLVIDSEIEILDTDGVTQLAFNEDVSSLNFCSLATATGLTAGSTYFVRAASSVMFDPMGTFSYELIVTTQ